MAWTFKQAGGTESEGFPGSKHTVPMDEWLIATEVITLTGAGTDQSTSVIDFIPYGKDWVIEVDPSATLTTNAEIDVDYCDTRDGTFLELATTAIEAAKDGLLTEDVMDNSDIGNRPYYKLRMDKEGEMDDGNAKTIQFKIYVAPPDGIIY